MKYHLSELPELALELRPGDIVFLRGNLGSGKTTLSQEILSRRGIDRNRIKSPTYTYFQKYSAEPTGGIFYHFDLYRIAEYETFLNIGGEEYLSDPQAIKLVEWPEILGNTFIADVEISLAETEDPETREITVTYRDAERKGGDIG
jgi:tRNA threonylcarbamoyladenosine biosynthesis protein TsaE